MEEYFDLVGFEECSEAETSSIQEAEGGVGWGSFVLGAAAGMVGAVSPARKLLAKDNCQELVGLLKKSEKKFIAELWKFEEELDHATENKNLERIFLLINGFNGCLNGKWKVLIPGNPGYSGSTRLEELLQEFVLPIFQKASTAARINFSKKIPEKRLNHFCSKNISFEPDTWIFKWSDSDTPIGGTANT